MSALRTALRWCDSEGEQTLAALDGIRILDLTQFEAGPSCTQILAWLGADVIKIEAPHGEPGRGVQRGPRTQSGQPTLEADFDSMYFIVNNANKRSVTLDLRTDKDRDILRALCRKGDVLVESFAPGAIERLGFGYDEVRELNPRLVFASLKGFDPEGPYGQYLSFNSVAQPVGGIMSINGTVDGPPMMCGLSVGDTGAGLHLAIGILAALLQRSSTGRGQKVSVAMQEAMISMARVPHGQTQLTGKPAGRKGNGYAVNNAPADIYPCPPFGPNDFVSIYTSRATNSQQWHRLLDVLERPDLANDERFATSDARSLHAAEIDELINAWSVKHTKEEAMQILQDAGVPAGAVFDTVELQQDPHLNRNGTFASVTHAQRGEVKMPGCVIRLSDSSVPVVAAPLLGEHTREVIKEVLDLDYDTQSG